MFDQQGWFQRSRNTPSLCKVTNSYLLATAKLIGYSLRLKQWFLMYCLRQKYRNRSVSGYISRGNSRVSVGHFTSQNLCHITYTVRKMVQCKVCTLNEVPWQLYTNGPLTEGKKRCTLECTAYVTSVCRCSSHLGKSLAKWYWLIGPPMFLMGVSELEQHSEKKKKRGLMG